MIDAKPFDLSKLDFDAVRLKKRKKLLLWSLPAIIILLLAGAWLIVPSLLTQDAENNFKTAHYSVAASDVSSLHMLNLLESYKAFYNQGTAMSANGNQVAAVAKFETALAYTSDKDTTCIITYNLVLTMEGIGDMILTKPDLPGAINQYTTALNRLKANEDCFRDSALQKRIEAKIAAVEAARQNQSGSSSSSSSSSTADQQPSEDQQQKIKDNEQKATEERHDDQSLEDDSGYQDLPADVKPW